MCARVLYAHSGSRARGLGLHVREKSRLLKKPDASDKRPYGATAARLTPDQKVGSSNLSAVTSWGGSAALLVALAAASNGHHARSRAICALPSSSPPSAGVRGVVGRAPRAPDAREGAARGQEVRPTVFIETRTLCGPPLVCRQ